MPGISSAAAVDQPTRIISPVTPFAEMRVFSSIQVRYGERSRRYSDAVQCSALRRAAHLRRLGDGTQLGDRRGAFLPGCCLPHGYLPLCAVMLLVSVR